MVEDVVESAKVKCEDEAREFCESVPSSGWCLVRIKVQKIPFLILDEFPRSFILHFRNHVTNAQHVRIHVVACGISSHSLTNFHHVF